MKKWPSGPWRVDINQLGRHIRNNDRVIFTAPRVTYFEGQPERYENDLAAQHAALNLGAAAPDMYAATDWDWLIELENESLDDDRGGDNDFPIKLTVSQIRALMRARRKARGE